MTIMLLMALNLFSPLWYCRLCGPCKIYWKAGKWN